LKITPIPKICCTDLPKILHRLNAERNDTFCFYGEIGFTFQNTYIPVKFGERESMLMQPNLFSLYFTTSNLVRLPETFQSQNTQLSSMKSKSRYRFLLCTVTTVMLKSRFLTKVKAKLHGSLTSNSVSGEDVNTRWRHPSSEGIKS